jgi:beta-glucanase (GH16 family)
MKSITSFLAFVFLSLTFVCCGPDELPDVETQEVVLSATSVTLTAGDSVLLTTQLLPAGAKADVQWTSSNTKVATVVNGWVKGIARGAVTITAKADSVSSTCLATVNKEDLPYQLVWSDEFDATSLDLTKWNIETGGGGWGNNEKQYYTNRTDNVRLENGSLIIEAKKETYGSNGYTSARINTRNKENYTYGKIEARISLPAGKGTWPAYWMLGANFATAGWPTCGEVDIMEHIGSDPTMISHAVHTYEKNGAKGNNWSARKYLSNLEGTYHTYAIEWEKQASEGDDCIRFYIDGLLTGTLWEQHVGSTVKNWPFKSNFFFIFNVAVGGTMGGTVDDAIFNVPVLMKVDYIRVYQRL